MKDIECPECGAINLVSCWSDDYVCGECHEHVLGIEFSELYDMYKNEQRRADHLYKENLELRALVSFARNNFVEQEYGTDIEKAWLKKAEKYKQGDEG